MVEVVYNVDFLSTIFSHPAQEVFLLREERSTVKNVDKKREKRRGGASWFYSRDVLFYASVFTIKSLVGKKKKKKRKRKKKEENEKCFENLIGNDYEKCIPTLFFAKCN